MAHFRIKKCAIIDVQKSSYNNLTIIFEHRCWHFSWCENMSLWIQIAFITRQNKNANIFAQSLLCSRPLFFGARAFDLLAILSTCHFVNLPFCQLAILSTCYFFNLPFFQLAISSIICFLACHFINLLICHIVMWSTGCSTNLPLNQLA